MNAGKPLAEDKNHASSILARYEQGDSIEAIARGYGVSAGAIYRWLTRNAEEGWKEHLAARAHWQLDSAEEALRSASDGVQVSRARELMRAQQWRLERVLRRVWGTDAPSITVNLNLGDVGQRIVDLERELLGNAAVPQPKQIDCDREPSA